MTIARLTNRASRRRCTFTTYISCYDPVFVASLNAIHAKVSHAKTHFDALGLEIGQYLQANNYNMRVNHYANPQAIGLEFDSEIPIPPRIPFLVGDVIQNLRSALDYLVCELALAANTEPRRSHMFPICAKREGFARAKERNQLFGIPSHIVSEIEALQPYQLGSDWEKSALWILNELANTNKHRSILTARLSVDGDFTFNMQFSRASPEQEPTVTLVKTDAEKVVVYVAFDEKVVRGEEVGKLLSALIDVTSNQIVQKFESAFV